MNRSLAQARSEKPATASLFATMGDAARAEPLSQHSLKSLWRVRFSLRTHLRFCLALVSALAIAGGALWLTMDHLMGGSRVANPVLVDPATLSHSHAAPREARLVPAIDTSQASRISRRIDIAEGLDDGDARLYTYQHVVLDLDKPVVRSSHIDEIDRADTMPGGAIPGLNGLERGVPINVSLAKPASSKRDQVREIVVAPQSRERIGALLRAAGIASEDSRRLEEALARTELQPGDNLELLVDKQPRQDGAPVHVSLARFNHGDADKAVYGRADDGAFRATGNERLFARLSHDAMLSAYHPPAPVAADGSIPSRLAQAGAPPAIIDEVRTLASKNGVSLEKGGPKSPDRIELLFRKSAESGPELVFVEFLINGRKLRLFRHEGSSGSADYFNADGSSMTKYLMSKPLPNGRLNDGFGWRIHPVLHVRKHHNGVDYDAPIGSPIVAAGDGVVEVISWEKGYGKYVRIRHQGGYSTTYAHLSAAKKGLHVGQHVKQGEVIAYVGSTGYSTGPHLYYELKVGDRYVDPLKARLNAGEKLTGSSLSSFREEVDHVSQIFDAMKPQPLKDVGVPLDKRKPFYGGRGAQDGLAGLNGGPGGFGGGHGGGAGGMGGGPR